MNTKHLKKILSHKDLFNVLCSKNYSEVYKKSLFKKADANFVNTVCEFCDNLLKGNIKLSKKEFMELSKHKNILRKLSKSGSLNSKRKILNQKGGFLQYIIRYISNSRQFNK
jgi:hypothetical protein